MTQNGDHLVSDLGESGLIARILGRIGPTDAGVGPGDDAALVAVDASGVLFTTDALQENVDFDLSYCRGSDVGWKAVAVNASDIAAMGGRPRWAAVTMGVPARCTIATIDDLLEGLIEACARWGIGLAGGDISAASELWLSVAMIGSLIGRHPVVRDGARVGDSICVTGALGGAAGGLRILRNGRAGEIEEETAALVGRQLRPEARVDQAVALVPQEPSAMIDVSDGLALDLGRVLRASEVGCEIDPAALPIDAALEEVFPGEARELALAGGEDFELLFTIPQERAEAAVAAVRQTGVACTQIGAVRQGDAVVGEDSLAVWEGLGWDHLRSR